MGKKYAGMTVNERLFVGGLMEEFDNAVKEENIDQMTSILKQLELTEVSIKPIIEQIINGKIL